jgi:hypothetical protein
MFVLVSYRAAAVMTSLSFQRSGKFSGALSGQAPAELWTCETTPRTGVCEGESKPLSALAGSPLAGRYSQWLGASGRRYLFSVYDPSACPAYCDAILVLAKVDEHGRRTILAIEDTGDFADPAVSRAMQTAAHCDEAVEVHLHLLASTRPARRDAITDLLCYATPSRN